MLSKMESGSNNNALKTLKRISYFSLLFSLIALFSAYISQYIFGYQPCLLCLYQRKPYFIIIAISLFALLVSNEAKNAKNSIFCLIIGALLVNLAITFYHVGVEWKIFKGFDGCIIDGSVLTSDIESLKQIINETKAIRCDQPQFLFLGLSMAFCHLIYLIFGIFGFFFILKSKRKYKAQ
jgi:disulfide bond formation protein DsbB